MVLLLVSHMGLRYFANNHLVQVDDWTIINLLYCAGGMDYARLNQTLRFTPSVLQQRVQIDLIDDDLNDGVETFLLQLLPASDNLGSSGILAEATVEIDDNEGTL